MICHLPPKTTIDIITWYAPLPSNTGTMKLNRNLPYKLCDKCDWHPGMRLSNPQSIMQGGTLRVVSNTIINTSCTLPETNSSHLKMGAPWNLGDSDFGNQVSTIFRGEHVSFREGSHGKKTTSILLEKKQHCTKTVFICFFPNPILKKQKQTKNMGII